MHPTDTVIRPSQVFNATSVVHIAFLIAVVIYVVVGEVISATNPEFEGYLEPGFDMEPLLRLLFIGISVVQALLAVTWFRGNRLVETAIENSRKTLNQEPDAAVVAGGLQSAHILRLAMFESIAVYGLTLFLMGGERLDLYGFCAASFVGLLLIWPKRTGWENTFRSLSQRYSGVPSDPWQPESVAQ